jgi:hypothetical protein
MRLGFDSNDRIPCGRPSNHPSVCAGGARATSCVLSATGLLSGDAAGRAITQHAAFYQTSEKAVTA